MTGQLQIQPDTQINPRTQVTTMPGIDAKCEDGKTADDCRWPYCPCYSPDRPPYEENA